MEVHTRVHLSLSEVTTENKNFGFLKKSSKSGQLQAYIDYLHDFHKHLGVKGAWVINDYKGKFNLVTSPEITDVSSVRSYSLSKNVNFIHYVPYYKEITGGYLIEFRQRYPNFFSGYTDKKTPGWGPIFSPAISSGILNDGPQLPDIFK